MYRSFASDEGIFSAQLDHSIVSLADFRIPHHYTVSGVTSSTSSERCGSLDVIYSEAKYVNVAKRLKFMETFSHYFT